MTDEELGRRWCEANEKRPHRDDEGFFMWFMTRLQTFADGPANLPAQLAAIVSSWSYGTTEDAYTAVGVALRIVLAFADMSRVEVPT